MTALYERVETAFRNACLAELEALKPGNVHVFADGHGMVVQDFVRSAEAAAPAIAAPGLSVGQRIHHAVAATRQAVGCNTNLGIILLCAPLVHAALQEEGGTLRDRLRLVLRQLSMEDAAEAFRAIVLASPAGLGGASSHDVHDPATGTLLEAMRAAESRDRIAWQYMHDFADIFDSGLPCYRELARRWGWTAWAATAVHLTYMAAMNDTHIERKQGGSAADDVRRRAGQHAAAMLRLDNPKPYQRPLLQFDAELKAAGLNPGTSADLTVATLLADALERLLSEKG